MRTYSTVQVAEMLGIGNDTLHRWIRARKIAAPGVQLVGGVRIRLWSDTDVEIVRQYKKQSFWGKGISRKKRKKPHK
jgi:excisionase family DNA binding protein